MEYLKKRQKARKRLYSKVSIFGLVLLLLVLVRPTWSIFKKSFESKKNLSVAQVELADLEVHKRQLEKNVAYLQSDYGRDQEIRDKFGMTKNGETMVVIVRNEKEAPPPPPPEPTFWQKTKSRFLSVFGLE